MDQVASDPALLGWRLSGAQMPGDWSRAKSPGSRIAQTRLHPGGRVLNPFGSLLSRILRFRHEVEGKPTA
jgi:hypothetical protein